MTCPTTRILSDYSARELSSRQMNGVEWHLAHCEDCARLVAAERHASGVFGVLAVLAPKRARSAPMPPPMSAGTPSSSSPPSLLAGDILARVEQGMDVCVRRATPASLVSRSRLNRWQCGFNRAVAQAPERCPIFRGDGAEGVQVPLAAFRTSGAVLLGSLVASEPKPISVRTPLAPSRRSGTAQPPVDIHLQLSLDKVLWVIVYGLPSETKELAVLVFPTGNPQAARAALLQERDGRWLAEFPDVAPGDYALAIEPFTDL